MEKDENHICQVEMIESISAFFGISPTSFAKILSVSREQFGLYQVGRVEACGSAFDKIMSLYNMSNRFSKTHVCICSFLRYKFKDDQKSILQLFCEEKINVEDVCRKILVIFEKIEIQEKKHNNCISFDESMYNLERNIRWLEWNRQQQ